ncbi:MAG: gamma-glutamyltransferase [Rhodococcus sp. (in: high G+C Gram-positive bacteria)]|uniref:gamma-glutamyltransferase family protein n=1 Tax=Rhodococcus sp. TaxID=1831 RepID=UPI003BAF09EE
MSQRPPTLSVEGMVSSSHPAASTVGARVLADGGNAIDATLAMAAMTWLTLPGQCGIGGDAFAVVREPDGSVWTVGGSGFGPDGADIGFYTERGMRSIPLDGALAVAVPGAPAALGALHVGGASRALDDLWAPAMRAAERGLPCSAKTRRDVREAEMAVAADAGLSSVYLPDGRLPQIGELLPQRELAATIRELARDPRGFYTGSLAQRAVEALRCGGAPFSGDEWAAGAEVQEEAAISGRYAGAVLHQTPLPTPGWMVLQQAALCNGVVGFSPWLSAPAIDRMASAARMAFEDRLAICGTDNDAWNTLLESEAVAAARQRLDRKVAPTGSFDVSAGDTTSTVAVDSEGRAVSFIHSLAFTFGAKMTVPGTGVVLNNRWGRGAYLIPGHPNAAAPRRKPLHTLNAWVVTDTVGNLLHVGNTPGGDGQVQWNMQLISHLLDHGLDPAEAVAAPRFTVFPGSDANVVGQPAELRCESRLPEEVRAELEKLGHDITLQEPWGADGSAQIISVDNARGLLAGAADPRQEGIALGV